MMAEEGELSPSYFIASRFEVFFVGAEARIDMRGSAEWLEEKTAQWRFPVHIKVLLLRGRPAIQAGQSICHKTALMLWI